MQSPSPPVDARRQLTLLDATCIMVGIVVGSGIFRTPKDVAEVSPNLWAFFGIWIAGGVASLLGAMCYAELATRYPEDGGNYAYLNRAFGPWAGFLYAWTDFWIVRPANAGAVAFVLGDYAQAALRLGDHGALIYAVTAVVLSTALHLCGLHAGRWTQNAMSAAKVAGLLLLALAATVMPSAAVETTRPESGFLDLAKAWVFVMFCFGGWSDLSNVAAEVREPQKNMLRSLAAGILVITALYLLVNAAAVWSLGITGLAQSEAWAADVAQRGSPLGGRSLLGVLVAVSCLSSLIGVVFTGARVYYALGLRERMFAWLGHWNYRRNTPPQSLVAQALISCGLLLMAGQGNKGFERLVIFNGPCYWGFTLVTIIALMVLRHRDTTTPISFRIPFYPLTPLLFAGVCAALIAASVEWVSRAENFGGEAWYSIGVLLVGAILAVIAAVRR